MSSSSFRNLRKAILSKEQLAAFQSSPTYAKITSYIDTLNNAVVGIKLTDECAQSQVRTPNFVFLLAGSAGEGCVCDLIRDAHVFRESRR
jgi:hypothetical protein